MNHPIAQPELQAGSIYIIIYITHFHSFFQGGGGGR